MPSQYRDPMSSSSDTKLQVRDLMTSDMTALAPDDTLAVLRDLFDARRIRHMPVIDEAGLLIGLVTHRDLLRSALIARPDVPAAVENAVLDRVQVADLMTTELVTVGPDADVRDAAQQMLDGKLGCLPVVEDRRLVGILTESDFVRLMARGE